MIGVLEVWIVRPSCADTLPMLAWDAPANTLSTIEIGVEVVWVDVPTTFSEDIIVSSEGLFGSEGFTTGPVPCPLGRLFLSFFGTVTTGLSGATVVDGLAGLVGDTTFAFFLA